MSKISRSKITKEVQKLDSFQFEKLVAAIWGSIGYDTTVQQASKDRGIDVEALINNPIKQKLLIQVKRYKQGNKVGSQEVRNYATLYQQEENIDLVVLVTSSSFTKEAARLAQDLDVHVVDGQDITRKLIENKHLLDDFGLLGENNEDNHDYKANNLVEELQNHLEKNSRKLLDDNTSSERVVIECTNDNDKNYSIEIREKESTIKNTDNKCVISINIDPKFSHDKLENINKIDLYNSYEGTVVETEVQETKELVDVTENIVNVIEREGYEKSAEDYLE